jgi:hypothetical protein
MFKIKKNPGFTIPELKDAKYLFCADLDGDGKEYWATISLRHFMYYIRCRLKLNK